MNLLLVKHLGDMIGFSVDLYGLSTRNIRLLPTKCACDLLSFGIAAYVNIVYGKAFTPKVT